MSLEGGQQNDLEHTEYSILPHRRNNFTGIVSGGTIERDKVKKRQTEIAASIVKMSASVHRESLHFIQKPAPVTTAIEGNPVTFQCQIRGQKPIGEQCLV